MIPVLLALLSPAHAEEPADMDWSDVVLVWPDKFARWRDTRWLVAAEVVLPIGMVFGKENNKSFRTHAWQVKAVIACDQEYKFSGKRIEVGCTIEDIGLQATSIDRWKTDKGREHVQEVLDNIDGRLTGAKIQLQVNDRGAVTNLDLEGVDARNERERLQAETLRLVAARLMYPFHMKIPKSGMSQGQWVEFDSELMSMPTSTGIQGHATIVHYLNVYQGMLLVQDIGEGLVQVPRPQEETISFGGVDDSADAQGANEGAAVTGGDPEDTIAYALRMDGVSVYNIDNGIMEERVWSIVGTPSAQYLSTLKYWYSGRIQMLGEQETADVGPTRQMSYPGIEIEGLPVWLPVDPELRKGLDGFRPGSRVRVKKASQPDEPAP